MRRMEEIPILAPGAYRLIIKARGRQMAVCVDGRCVLRRDTALGRKPAIVFQDAEGVTFNDALAGPTGPELAQAGFVLPDVFGPGEKQWVDFSGKQFTDDEEMTLWSRGRSFWDAPAGGSGMTWFRTRLFNDACFTWARRDPAAACAWPAAPMEVVLFGDPGRPEDGIHFVLDGATARIARGGATLVAGTTTVSELTAWTCRAGAGAAVMELNGVALLTAPPAEPPPPGRVGAVLGPVSRDPQQPDWRDDARVTSTHRLDYGFDSAPAVGAYSLRLLNQELAGPAGAMITRVPCAAADFPLISFDHRFPAGTELNLLVNAAGRGWQEIRLTGPSGT